MDAGRPYPVFFKSLSPSEGLAATEPYLRSSANSRYRVVCYRRPNVAKHLGRFRIERVGVIDNHDETFSTVGDTLPGKWRRDICTSREYEWRGLEIVGEFLGLASGSYIKDRFAFAQSR